MSKPDPRISTTSPAPGSQPSSVRLAADSRAVFEQVWGGGIQRIFALDSSRAWTAEDGSRIRATKNAGQTWTFQATPDNSRGTLESVFFLLDGVHGWAVSDDGLVLSTDSAGTAGWTLLTPVPLLDPTAPQNKAKLYDVRFVDQQHGWLAGLHLLKRTSDGGQSWIDVDVRDSAGNPLDMSDVELYALAFISQGGQQIGLATAEPGLILRSTDPLGQRWRVVLDIDDPLSLQPHCNSTDRLEIWDVAFVPGTPIQAAVAYAVSGLGNGCGYTFSTMDGGQTWQQEPYAPGGFNQHVRAFALYGVSAFADGRAIACGYGGMVLVRDPAEAVWRDVTDTRVLATQPLTSVSCDPHALTPPLAWAAGEFGAIRRTRDRGMTWADQAGTQAWRLLAIEFPQALSLPSEATGWVAGQQYRIARTTDGGANLVEQRAEAPGSVDFGHVLRSIAFADLSNGVALGAPSALSGNPVIFFTTAGGDEGSWTRATPPAGLLGIDLPGVCWSGLNASAENEFWAASANGVVIHSVDGGATWSEVPLLLSGQPLPPRWNALCFTDLGSGLFVGTWADGSAAAVRIENAQAEAPTWVDVSPGIAEELLAVSADPASGVAYAVGRQGTIYTLAPLDSAFQPDRAAMALVPPGVDLFAVRVVPVGATFQVFVGGQRGLVLRLAVSEWSTPKSQTSLTIIGFSFPNSAFGFAVGGLQEGTSIILRCTT